MRGFVYGRNGQVSFSSSEEFYYTLVFLADYRRAALYWEHNEDQGAWGSEGRIHCLIPQERFSDFFKFTAGRGTGVYARINCNDYVGCLVEDHKFKVKGARQDVETIMSTVPEMYRDAFMKRYGDNVELAKVKVLSVQNSSKEVQHLKSLKSTINARKGDRVRHKKFGDGVIKKISGSNMTISFGKDDKFFQYLGAFEQGFLLKM